MPNIKLPYAKLFGNTHDQNNQVNKTQNNNNSSLPIINIAAPFPDIQTYYNVPFECYLPLTITYFSLSPNRDLSHLIFSIQSYVPEDTSKWVNFDQGLRKFSGIPPRKAASETMVALSVDDELMERSAVVTSFRILVSFGPSGKIELPEKVIAILIAFVVMIVILVVFVVLATMWKRYCRFRPDC
ncbi:7480_t:CDS:1 [Ambispora leptoticha]|uniref:7480_t:CDS:1 n=1 Tax=Ambispora leptoticha TaxID=144679 RepID=A0A9N9AVD9_9GLOM|nr:7480_t:CDS:1 [Ambispora leptoticha]